MRVVDNPGFFSVIWSIVRVFLKASKAAAHSHRLAEEKGLALEHRKGPIPPLSSNTCRFLLPVPGEDEEAHRGALGGDYARLLNRLPKESIPEEFGGTYVVRD